jgi:deazaflavin-dependent oxidoreductase (nitroreductase family)
MHALTRGHRLVDAASGGRLGHSVLVAPSVWLTTTGRRSGHSRRVPLVAARDGDGGYLVAGSAGGSERTPDWVFNLRGPIERGEPARLQDRDVVRSVVVEELAGAERDAGFAAMVRVYRGFAGYERAARRTIPVFRLTPCG